MELTANRRPFLYVPLQNHFEQNFHVRHRLEQLRRRPLRDATTDASRPGRCWPRRSPRRSRAEVHYRPVETDGAARAADMLAELI